MSRTSTYLPDRHQLRPVSVPIYARADVLWTERPEATGISFPNYPEVEMVKAVSSSINIPFFNEQARAIAAIFHEAIQLLVQASIVSNRMVYTSSLDQEQPNTFLESDEWIDMPPHTTQKVVMKARFAGRGEPLAFFDEE